MPNAEVRAFQLERSIKFTVSKDRHSLCDRCSVKEELSTSTSVTPFVPTSTPSSASFEQIDPYPRSESVDSETHENMKSEDCSTNYREVRNSQFRKVEHFFTETESAFVSEASRGRVSTCPCRVPE